MQVKGLMHVKTKAGRSRSCPHTGPWHPLRSEREPAHAAFPAPVPWRLPLLLLLLRRRRGGLPPLLPFLLLLPVLLLLLGGAGEPSMGGRGGREGGIVGGRRRCGRHLVECKQVEG